MGTKRERSPGVWQLRASAGLDPIDGRRRVVTETFRGSERAATKRLGELDREVERSGSGGALMTLRATIAEWRAQSTHASGTSRNYDLAVSTIPAHLMRTPIGKIRSTMIRELNSRVTADHGVHRTRQVQAVISGALTYAWQQEWIPSNVALRVQLPSPAKRVDTTPSIAELERILAIAKASPEIYAWVLTSSMVGGRPSETLALRWSDVDLEVGEIWITKALDPVGGGVKLTKTEDERKVAIGPKVIAALHRWRVAFLERAMVVGVKPVKDPFVFTHHLSLDGAEPWRPQNATRRFTKLRNKANVGDCRLYDLRHYVATNLLVAGVPAKVVSGRMGHKRVQTTVDLYGHAIPAADRSAAETLERNLR